MNISDAGAETERGADEPAWHAMEPARVHLALATSADGLSGAEAASRLARLGANRLPGAVERSWLRRLLEQLNNSLIYVLIAAALISALIGHFIDAGVILAVIAVNSLVGYLQEGRAEKSLQAIRSMIAPRASAIRDGRRATIAASDIVPGDLILREAGDKVPADLRLVRSSSL